VSKMCRFWRNGWWNGVYFSTIGTVKASLGEDESLFVKFWGGVVGGGVATTFATPFDVAKSRMQGSALGAGKYRWAWQTLFTIFREEGFRACYKGYSARLLRYVFDSDWLHDCSLLCCVRVCVCVCVCVLFIVVVGFSLLFSFVCFFPMCPCFRCVVCMYVVFVCCMCPCVCIYAFLPLFLDVHGAN
jgi:Mitochondrial carrier protein